jgi:uncharacterized protein YaaN involved in tellurite resistance
VAMLNPMRKELENMTSSMQKAHDRADDLEAQLSATRRELAECQAMVGQLHRQLQFYRDRYGPPPREIR